MLIRAERPEWGGRTVVCIASGPSLTAADCEAVRCSGHPTVVTNTTFRLCPWADVLIGFDKKWWDEYGDEVGRDFRGRRMSASNAVGRHGAESLYLCTWFRAQGNSGSCAASMAIAAGAAKVVLLGYDCQFTGGQAHWHGSHPRNLSNCRSLKDWPRLMRHVAAEAAQAGVQVLNASRATALRCFERADLADAL